MTNSRDFWHLLYRWLQSLILTLGIAVGMITSILVAQHSPATAAPDLSIALVALYDLVMLSALTIVMLLYGVQSVSCHCSAVHVSSCTQLC
jgi:hypothetical protein